MKVPVCGKYFQYKRLDGRSTNKIGKWGCVNVGKAHHRKERDTRDFTWKPLIRKTTGRRRKFSIILRLQELQKLLVSASELGLTEIVPELGLTENVPKSPPFLVEGVGLLILSCWYGSRWVRARSSWTCGLVVTTVITGTDLLELHVGKSITIYSCPRWETLQVMNVGEGEEV